jgi:flavin-binding protein dodecin
VQKAIELIGTGATIQDAVTEALDRARMTLAVPLDVSVAG